MASLDMKGSYELDSKTIDEKINKTSAGNYALGKIKDKSFIVSYVGRSDSDVNSRLKDHVGKHPKFKYSYASSPKAAFQKECENYHDFGEDKKLKNRIHPDRPENSDWKCPKCKKYD